jgi:hypothetical protein
LLKYDEGIRGDTGMRPVREVIVIISARDNENMNQ